MYVNASRVKKRKKRTPPCLTARCSRQRPQEGGVSAAFHSAYKVPLRVEVGRNVHKPRMAYGKKKIIKQGKYQSFDRCYRRADV